MSDFTNMAGTKMDEDLVALADDQEAADATREATIKLAMDLCGFTREECLSLFGNSR